MQKFQAVLLRKPQNYFFKKNCYFFLSFQLSTHMLLGVFLLFFLVSSWCYLYRNVIKDHQMQKVGWYLEKKLLIDDHSEFMLSLKKLSLKQARDISIYFIFDLNETRRQEAYNWILSLVVNPKFSYNLVKIIIWISMARNHEFIFRLIKGERKKFSKT